VLSRLFFVFGLHGKIFFGIHLPSIRRAWYFHLDLDFPPKRRFTSRLHGTISQKMATFSVILYMLVTPSAGVRREGTFCTHSMSLCEVRQPPRQPWNSRWPWSNVNPVVGSMELPFSHRQDKLVVMSVVFSCLCAWDRLTQEMWPVGWWEIMKANLRT
jgi:hypothetical protein